MRRTIIHPWPLMAGLGLCFSLNAGALAANAAPPVADSNLALKQLFEAAWIRQPEARSLSKRQDAAQAQREVADSWTAAPPTLEFSTEGDQLHGNGGSREHIAGVSVPLWLPGERDSSGALADAQGQATRSRTLAAQLRTAASVREGYWQWQRACLDQQLASQRLHSLKELSSDVAKRVRLGDMTRADQHQADSAQAQAEAELAEVNAQLFSATQEIRALTGRLPGQHCAPTPSAEALPADFELQENRHPSLLALADQAQIARSHEALARSQTRANPELSLATTRERDDSSDNYQDSLTLGIRIPLGSSSRNRAKQAQAEAEAIEADTQLSLIRERTAAELDAARQRLEASRTQQRLAEQRARLAQETRGFVEKSFRLGETDLPNRLRVERDALDAEQQAARARLELAAATSTLRQALGLLPE